METKLEVSHENFSESSFATFQSSYNATLQPYDIKRKEGEENVGSDVSLKQQEIGPITGGDEESRSIENTSPTQECWGRYEDETISENRGNTLSSAMQAIQGQGGLGQSNNFQNRSLNGSVAPSKLSFHQQFSPATNSSRYRPNNLSGFVSEFSLDSKVTTEDMKNKSNVSIPLPKNQSSMNSMNGLGRAYSLTSMDSFTSLGKMDSGGFNSMEIGATFTTDEDNDDSTKTNSMDFEENYNGTPPFPLNQDMNYIGGSKEEEEEGGGRGRGNQSVIMKRPNSMLSIQNSPSSPSNSSSSLASGGTTNSTSSAITTTNSNISKESNLSSTKTGLITDRTRELGSSITGSMTRGIRSMALTSSNSHKKEIRWDPNSSQKSANNEDESNIVHPNDDGTMMNQTEEEGRNKNKGEHDIDSTIGYDENRNSWDQNLNLDFNVPFDVDIDLSLIDDADEEILKSENQKEHERHSFDIINLEHSNENHLTSTGFPSSTRRQIAIEHNMNSTIHSQNHVEESMNAPTTQVAFSSNTNDYNLVDVIIDKTSGNKTTNTNHESYPNKAEKGVHKKEKTNITGKTMKLGLNQRSKSLTLPIEACNLKFDNSSIISLNSMLPQYQVNDAINFELQQQFNNLSGMENPFCLPNFGINPLYQDIIQRKSNLMNLAVPVPQSTLSTSAADLSGGKSNTSNHTYSAPVMPTALGRLPINPQGGPPYFDSLMNGNSLSSPLNNIVSNPFSMAFLSNCSNPQSYSAPGSPNNMDYHTISRFNNGNNVNFLNDMNNQTSLLAQKSKSKSPKGQKSPGSNGVAHIKNKWGAEEDLALTKLVNDFGTKNWVVIATRLGTNRTGKQCRERWVNQLDPSICKEVWSPEEERILTRAHEKYGNKWAKIAKLLPGRSDNACKNKINGAIKRHQKQRVTDDTKKGIYLSSSPKKSKVGNKKSLNGKNNSLDHKMVPSLESSLIMNNPLSTISQSFKTPFTASNASLDNSRTLCESSYDNSGSISLSSPSSSSSSPSRQNPNKNENERKPNSQTPSVNKTGKRSQDEAALRTAADLASNPSIGDFQLFEGKLTSATDGKGTVMSKEGYNIPRNVSLHIIEQDDLIKKRRLSMEKGVSNTNLSASSNINTSNSGNNISYQGQSHTSDDVDFDLDLTNHHDGNITSLLQFSHD